MNVIDEIKEAWGWIGIDPIAVVGENDFGNLIIEDSEGKYWRLCPEDLYCKIVANNREELDRLSVDQEFLADWYMEGLAEQAKDQLGVLIDGEKYCFVTPGTLGGEYAVSNIKTAPLLKMIRFSGDVANQIKELPDGAQIKLKVVD